MKSYKQKKHFEYFKDLAYPYVGVTVNADITELVHFVKENQLPFFLSMCYCVSMAANQIPDFARGS